MTDDFNADGTPKKITMPLVRIPNAPHPVTRLMYSIWKDEETPYLSLGIRKVLISSSEAHMLYDVPRRLGPGLYANLGVGSGYSTGCLAFGLKTGGFDGKVLAVDTFLWRTSRVHFDSVMIKEKYAAVGIMDYVVFCEGLTYDWAPKYADQVLNFVFIDADHEYESCKKDFELWSPMIKVGGELAFHDVNFNTVDRVINELDPTKWEQINHISYTKLFRRIR